MKWYRNLYLGEGAKQAKYKMFGRIRRGRFQLDTYLITLSDNPDNLLDMFSANIDDVYQQTGAFDIPGYLKFGRNRTR